MKHNPIWIKNKSGGYDRIPYDKMTQLPNGSWGNHLYSDATIFYDFVSKHLDHFEYQPVTNMWIFMPEKNRAARGLKWADHFWAAILGANTMVLCVSLYQHEYALAVVLLASILSLFGVKYTARRR